MLLSRAFRVGQVHGAYNLLPIRAYEHLAHLTGDAAMFRRSLAANGETRDIGNVVFDAEVRAYRELRQRIDELLDDLPDDPALDSDVAADLAATTEQVTTAGKAFRAGLAYSERLSQRVDRLGLSLFLAAVAAALLVLVGVMWQRGSARAMLFLGSSFLLANVVSTTLAYL